LAEVKDYNMESTNTKKIIIGAVTIVVLAFAVYYLFFRTKTPVVTLDQYGNPVVAQSVGADLVELLNKLQSVTLDQSIFKTPAFLYLTDFSVPLPTEAPGRKNPFDVLPGFVQSVSPAKSIPTKTR
jgi:hypothetical protein